MEIKQRRQEAQAGFAVGIEVQGDEPELTELLQAPYRTPDVLAVLLLGRAELCLLNGIPIAVEAWVKCYLAPSGEDRGTVERFAQPRVLLDAVEPGQRVRPSVRHGGDQRLECTRAGLAEEAQVVGKPLAHQSDFLQPTQSPAEAQRRQADELIASPHPGQQ